MFEILPVNDDDVLAIKVSGKLTDADYKQFLPQLEAMIGRAGRISLYVEMHDFEGWDAKAAWDDMRFGLQHDDDFRRIAIVTDKTLIHAATHFINVFSHIEMRVFDFSESSVAWDWLREAEDENTSQPLTEYRHILLPTDFSGLSDVAAQRALQLAEQHGASLHVMHAVDDIIYYNEAYDPIVAESPLPDDFFMIQAEEHMQKFSERNRFDGKAEITTQWGNPKRSIISLAHELDIDLIVMGAHGRHGLSGLMGSVSTAVLHKVSCDVLIVRHQGGTVQGRP